MTPQLENELYTIIEKLNSFDFKQEYLDEIENMIIKEKINPSKIKIFNFSLISWFAMSKHTNDKIFKTLLKYTNEEEKPNELASVWIGLAIQNKKTKIQHYLKYNDFQHINTPHNEKTPVSNLVSIIFSNSKKTPPIEKVFTPNLELLLKNGGDINNFHESVHIVDMLISIYKDIPTRAKKIIDHCLEYNFNPNLIFNKKNKNNFILEILSNNTNSIILESIVEKQIPIDFEYKNSKNKTIKDFMNNIKKPEIYSYFEQQYIQSQIKNQPLIMNKTTKRL